MGITEGRVYAGMSPADRTAERRARLLQAALDVMGTPGHGPLTVRKVIEASGLSPRYFYDHFTSLEDLQVAVFDELVEQAERLALAAMVATRGRAEPKTRAVLQAMVDFLLEDPRKGRVLLVEPLSSPALMPRYAAEVRRFAGLLAEYSPAAWRGEDVESRRVQVTARFALGGFTSTLNMALTSSEPIDRIQLADDLTLLFLGVGSAFRRLAD